MTDANTLAVSQNPLGLVEVLRDYGVVELGRLFLYLPLPRYLVASLIRKLGHSLKQRACLKPFTVGHAESRQRELLNGFVSCIRSCLSGIQPSSKFSGWIEIV